jgi:hypothetical protein
MDVLAPFPAGKKMRRQARVDKQKRLEPYVEICLKETFTSLAPATR